MCYSIRVLFFVFFGLVGWVFSKGGLLVDEPPSLLIVSLVDGKEVVGARVIINGEGQLKSTPLNFVVKEKGKYRIKVFPNSASHLPFVIDYVGHKKGAKKLLAVCKKCISKKPLLGRVWIVPSCNLKLLPVKRGNFMMGAKHRKSSSDEQPVHLVNIAYDFWMAETETTQEVYEMVMGDSPSKFKGETRPVESVCWHDAVKFCKLLTMSERKLGRVPAGYCYRLPTEAEWEFCCRAGTKGNFSCGDALTAKDAAIDGKKPYPKRKMAMGKVLRATVPVARYKSNGWGFYDMHGNVWEFCQDWYNRYDAKGDEVEKGFKVKRGGSWYFGALSARSSKRSWEGLFGADDNVGFRVVLAPCL